MCVYIFYIPPTLWSVSFPDGWSQLCLSKLHYEIITKAMVFTDKQLPIMKEVAMLQNQPFSVILSFFSGAHSYPNVHYETLCGKYMLFQPENCLTDGR